MNFKPQTRRPNDRPRGYCDTFTSAEKLEALADVRQFYEEFRGLSYAGVCGRRHRRAAWIRELNRRRIRARDAAEDQPALWGRSELMGMSVWVTRSLDVGELVRDRMGNAIGFIRSAHAIFPHSQTVAFEAEIIRASGPDRVVRREFNSLGDGFYCSAFDSALAGSPVQTLSESAAHGFVNGGMIHDYSYARRLPDGTWEYDYGERLPNRAGDDAATLGAFLGLGGSLDAGALAADLGLLPPL